MKTVSAVALDATDRKMLRALQADGLIACGYNRIRLLDVPALKAFAYRED